MKNVFIFIKLNKCARENLATIPQFHSPFFVRYKEELTFLIMKSSFGLVERHYTCIIVNIA